MFLGEGGDVTTLSGMVFCNFLGKNIFLLGPPTARNSDLVVFWPILGHLEKFRARTKKRKLNCTVLGALLWKKMLPRHPGWFSAPFLGKTFFFVGPLPAGNSNLMGFRPILGLWHLGKFRAQAENTKTRFPGARGTFTGAKMLPRYLGWFFATFWGNTFFLVGPPPAGNSDLVGFWPILGLWHLKKFRAQAENTKTQFPGARGTFMRGNVTALSAMVFRNFLAKVFCLVGSPQAGNSNLVGVGPVLAHFQVPKAQIGPK